MGTWDTGPFDNDHAADFAASVADRSDEQARADLFMITFMAVTDTPDDHFTSRCTPGYELPYEFLEVIASAAYLADARTGTHRWTDNPYAMGTEDGGLTYQFVEIAAPTDAQVGAAHLAMTKVLKIMEYQEIEPEWREAPWLIIESLGGGK